MTTKKTTSAAPWGVDAVSMPDECHDECNKAGDRTVPYYYYPYKWRAGIARYRCARGHTWTCGWGHRESGEASEMSGKAHVYGEFGGIQTCRDDDQP